MVGGYVLLQPFALDPSKYACPAMVDAQRWFDGLTTNQWLGFSTPPVSVLRRNDGRVGAGFQPALLREGQIRQSRPGWPCIVTGIGESKLAYP